MSTSVDKIFWSNFDHFIWLSLKNDLAKNYLSKMQNYRNKNPAKFESVMSSNPISRNHPFLKNETKCNLKLLSSFKEFEDLVMKNAYNTTKTRISHPIVNFVNFDKKLVEKTNATVTKKIMEMLIKQIFYSFLKVEVKFDNYSDNFALLSESTYSRVKKYLENSSLIEEFNSKKSVRTHLIIALVKMCTTRSSQKEIDLIEEWIKNYLVGNLNIKKIAYEAISKYSMKISQSRCDFRINNDLFYHDIDLLINDDEIIELRWDSEEDNFSHLAGSALIMYPDYRVKKLTSINLFTGCTSSVCYQPHKFDDLINLDSKANNVVINIDNSIRVNTHIEKEIDAKLEYEDNYFSNKDGTEICMNVSLLIFSTLFFAGGILLQI